MSRIILLPHLLVLVLVATSIGCQPALTRGSSSAQGEHGVFFMLDYFDSQHDVGVAYVFPKKIDVFATYDGTGGDYLSMSDGKWHVDRIVRFEDNENGIDISFNYLATTSRFTFRGETHSLKVNEMVVIRFDDENNYDLEILALNDDTKNKLLNEMGISDSREIGDATGFDALAQYASGANVAVTLGRSESLQFQKPGPVTGLNCRIEFTDNENERPTLCERSGFYAAMLLHHDSLVGDNQLSYRPPAPEKWLPAAAGLSTPTDNPTRNGG